MAVPLFKIPDDQDQSPFPKTTALSVNPVRTDSLLEQRGFEPPVSSA
jgi:hypothetical protein